MTDIVEDAIMQRKARVSGSVEGVKAVFTIKCGALPDMRPKSCSGKKICDSICLNCKYVIDVDGTIPPGGVDNPQQKK